MMKEYDYLRSEINDLTVTSLPFFYHFNLIYAVTVNNFISQRIEAERKDEVRKEKNAIHFNKNKDCQEAYKRFFCW